MGYKPKSDKVGSVVCGRKLVRQDCLTYWDHIRDVEVQSLSIKSIPAVSSLESLKLKSKSVVLTDSSVLVFPSEMPLSCLNKKRRVGGGLPE